MYGKMYRDRYATINDANIIATQKGKTNKLDKETLLQKSEQTCIGADYY